MCNGKKRKGRGGKREKIKDERKEIDGGREKRREEKTKIWKENKKRKKIIAKPEREREREREEKEKRGKGDTSDTRVDVRGFRTHPPTTAYGVYNIQKCLQIYNICIYKYIYIYHVFYIDRIDRYKHDKRKVQKNEAGRGAVSSSIKVNQKNILVCKNTDNLLSYRFFFFFSRFLLSIPENYHSLVLSFSHS